MPMPSEPTREPGPPRTILAIECSTPEATVAIRGRSGVILEHPVTTGDRTRDHLPPAVDRLIREAELDRRRLDGIAVSEGPGGFTGLRVSVAFAKGVAEALDIPALGVPSAAVAATAALADDDPREAIVVMATKRGTAWIETIALDASSGLRRSRVGRLVDADSAREFRGGSRVVLADPRQDPGIVAALAGEGVPATIPRFSAAALVRIAERSPHDAWADAAALAVRYPRVPEAVTMWNARHAAR